MVITQVSPTMRPGHSIKVKKVVPVDDAAARTRGIPSLLTVP